MQRGWDGPEALAGLMSQGLHLGSHPPHTKSFQAPDQAWHLQQQHAMMALPHGAGLPPELAHLAAAGAAPYRPAAAGAHGGVALANGYTAAPPPPQSVGWGGQSIPENGTFKARRRLWVPPRLVTGLVVEPRRARARAACRILLLPGLDAHPPLPLRPTLDCRPPGLASRGDAARRRGAGVGAGAAARPAPPPTACAATGCAATTAVWAGRATS